MSVGPSVSQYVGNTLLFQHFWVVLSLPFLPKCLVSLITAPAHLHATLVAVFPAFFFIFSEIKLLHLCRLRKERKKDKQVMQGHNIVVDGWAGASNPHSLAKPPYQHSYPKNIENAGFPTFRLVCYGPLDQRTDKASYRVACPQLKT